MSRIFKEKTLLIASHNQGKLYEMIELLAPYNIEIKTARDLNIPEPEETEETFEGNAILKARFCMRHSGLPALADDSGLVVPALGGRPGVYSARWAGPEKNFNKAMNQIEEELGNEKNVEAHFISTLALCWPDEHVEVVTARCDGRLTFPGRGIDGHGYDPIFIKNGYTQTFGEMTLEKKNSISHRAAALEKLLKECFIAR